MHFLDFLPLFPEENFDVNSMMLTHCTNINSRSLSILNSVNSNQGEEDVAFETMSQPFVSYESLIIDVCSFCSAGASVGSPGDINCKTSHNFSISAHAKYNFSGQ